MSYLLKQCQILNWRTCRKLRNSKKPQSQTMMDERQPVISMSKLYVFRCCFTWQLITFAAPSEVLLVQWFKSSTWSPIPNAISLGAGHCQFQGMTRLLNLCKAWLFLTNTGIESTWIVTRDFWDVRLSQCVARLIRIFNLCTCISKLFWDKS